MCKHISVFTVLLFIVFTSFAQSEKSATDLYKEGLALSKGGNCKDAIEKYKAAIAKNLGDIYYSNKDYEHATEYFKKYIDDSKDVDNIYYYRIGWSFNDLGKY